MQYQIFPFWVDVLFDSNGHKYNNNCNKNNNSNNENYNSNKANENRCPKTES